MHSVRTRETDTALIRGEITAYQQDGWDKGQEWEQYLTVPSLLKQVNIQTKAIFYGPNKSRDLKNMNCNTNIITNAMLYANRKYRKRIKVNLDFKYLDF